MKTGRAQLRRGSSHREESPKGQQIREWACENVVILIAKDLIVDLLRRVLSEKDPLVLTSADGSSGHSPGWGHVNLGTQREREREYNPAQ